MRSNKKINHRRSSGFMLTPILLAIILTATFITVSAYVSRSQGSRAQAIVSGQAQLSAQANLIRDRIQLCATTDGMTGLLGDNGTAINPSMPYTGTSAGTKAGGATAGTAGNVKDLYCPRTLNAGAYIVGVSDLNLWTRMGESTLPPPPAGFSAWQFSNTAAAVKITTTNATDPDAARMISTASSSFGVGEVPAVLSATTFTLCLRVYSGSC